jgi:diketogulonate reductase-like aldo/keto reductase
MSVGAGAGTASVLLERLIPAAGDGESLPLLGMGTWRTFDVDAQVAREPLLQVAQEFYSAGARVLDTSPMYGAAEAICGEIMAKFERRSQTFLATKVWTRGRAAGQAQIQRSMQLLQTQQLDLLQIHNLLDWRVHASTLRELKAAGSVRYIGVTHYKASAHSDLEAALRAEPFDFVQLNYSLATRAADARLLPFCQEQGIGVLVNRPFEEGQLLRQLSGRALPSYAAEIGCADWAQFCLKFIISHPAVSCVIPASSTALHMRSNLQAGCGVLPDMKLRRRMVTDANL